MGRGVASRRQFGGNGASVPARHYASETNGAVERFHQSLKYEHLYQREIDQASPSTRR
jgi:hypothetical protein